MHVLVVDDDRSIRRSLEKFLLDLGYRVSTAEDGEQGLEALLAGDIDLCLLDLGLPRRDGLSVLEALQGRENTPPVVVITARDDLRSTVTAIQRGAWDYLVKPLDIERLKITVRRALESRELTRRLDGLVETFSQEVQVDNVVGRTPAMREVFKTLGRVSTSNATVLLTGESGTGKELVARALHFASPSRDQPFIAVNCSAIPRDLLESELFGHVKGAFTGAVADKLGRCALAGSGTLFLDEIGEMPPELQAKILRVVQERTFERVGDARPQSLKARIVAATHRDLPSMVREGTFREDLYFRLGVFPIRLPTLREREGDVPLLAAALLSRVAPQRRLGLAPAALALLAQQPFPGNVRELRNLLERAALLCDGEVLERSHVAAALAVGAPPAPAVGVAPPPAPPAPQPMPAASPSAPGGDSLRALERQALRERVLAHRGSRAELARALGISERSLYRHLRHLRDLA